MPPQNKPEYKVDAAERVKAILGDTELNEESTLLYSYDQGYEVLKCRKRADYGGFEYRGSYHPNVVCEGTHVCIHCGRTL